MCTKCVYLAGKYTPYFSMGLGIYYTTTPETFALISDLKVCAFRLFLDIQKKRLGYGSVSFSLQNTKAPPCKSPDSPYFRTTIRYQTDVLLTGASQMKVDNFQITNLLQLSLLVSPPQLRCPSRSVSLLPSQRRPDNMDQYDSCLLTQIPPKKNLQHCYFNIRFVPITWLIYRQ